MEVKLPLPFVITAAGYAEKYGPDERHNYLQFAAGVPLSLLVTFGTVEAENNMAFRGAAQALEQLKLCCRHLSVATVPGADHFYTGVREELAVCLEAWLRSVWR